MSDAPDVVSDTPAAVSDAPDVVFDTPDAVSLDPCVVFPAHGVVFGVLAMTSRVVLFGKPGESDILAQHRAGG